MTRWVRNRRAIYTVVMMDGLQVGDEIIEARVGCKTGKTFRIKHDSMRQACVNAWSNPKLSNGYWKLIAWRRPKPKEESCGTSP